MRDVNDGDTLDAHVPRDGLGGLLRVRIIGIQAMEQTSYRAAQRAGDCHAVDATNRLEQLVKRSKQRIRVAVAVPGEPLARPPAALRRGPLQGPLARRRADHDHRGPRAVAAGPQRGRHQRPLQRPDPARGRGEGASSRPTTAASGPTRATRSSCGRTGTPTATTPRTSTASGSRSRTYDPVNPLPLGGWYVRDTGLRRFTFPPGAVHPAELLDHRLRGPGPELRQRVLLEPDRARVREHHARRPRDRRRRLPVRPPGRHPRLDDLSLPDRLRRPRPGPGRDRRQPAAQRGRHDPQQRDVADSTSRTTCSRATPYGYAFPPGSILEPGETMRVFTQGDPGDDTPFEKHWGMTRQILNNGGDSASSSATPT